MKFSMTRQEKGFIFYTGDWIAEVTTKTGLTNINFLESHSYLPCIYSLLVWFMVFNSTFNNISVTQKMYIVAVSFIDEGNRSTRRKPLTCRRSLTNSIT